MNFNINDYLNYYSLYNTYKERIRIKRVFIPANVRKGLKTHEKMIVFKLLFNLDNAKEI